MFAVPFFTSAMSLPNLLTFFANLLGPPRPWGKNVRKKKNNVVLRDFLHSFPEVTRGRSFHLLAGGTQGQELQLNIKKCYLVKTMIKKLRKKTH